MLNWQLGDHRAECATSLARIRIDVDWPHSGTSLDALRYKADIANVSLQPLAGLDNIMDIPTAQRWCEREYVNLLQLELEDVSSPSPESIARREDAVAWLRTVDWNAVPLEFTEQIIDLLTGEGED